jgi:hypothetical protein
MRPPEGPKKPIRLGLPLGALAVWMILGLVVIVLGELSLLRPFG